MKVNIVNNSESKNVQNTFGARFRAGNINKFLKFCDVQENNFQNKNAIPKLYTMLELIDKQPAKTAKLLKSKDAYGPYFSVKLDSEELGKSRIAFENEKQYSYIYALYSACINILKKSKGNALDNLSAEKLLRKMSTKNKNVTRENVMKFTYNA